jgi:hypothetical protein
MATAPMEARISALAQKIDELFVKQASRFAFHHEDTQNEHRMQETRLSSLMLDKSVSNEKHLEYAQAIISRCDSYKRDFILPLQDLTEEIQRDLFGFEQVLHASAQLGDLSKVERWLSLSKDLHQARLMAMESIESQTEFETYIPKLIIQNDGRSDMTLSSEQSEQFAGGIAGYAALMKTSHETNERIQQEREPLTKLLFSPDKPERTAGPQIPATPERTPIKIHPLEGKGWFRLLKVMYVATWIVGLGILAIFASGTGEFAVFVVSGVIFALALIVLKKVFYYVILGRATATEQPGKGFLDLEELRNDLVGVQANSPDVYQEVVAPFFQSWKERYGRRVPLQEVEVMQKRIDYEMNRLKEKKQELIDKAASKGATIDLSTLRKNMEQTKADYNGADRQEYVRQIDLFLTSLEVKYGASIPIDEANKLLDKLDDDIRAQGGRSSG